MTNVDIAIIGAGPSGLFAAFYAGMRSLSTVIIDSLEMPGGQLAALYPEKYIYDIPGFEKIKAQELVTNLTKQLDRFSATTEFKLNSNVMNIEKNEDGTFKITTQKEEMIAKSIIIAAGNGQFAPRPLGVDNEDKYDNIHYFVNDLSTLNNKDVVIFGGGDSAVDWSLELNNNAKSVHLVHRRNEFRAHGHSVELLKETNVNIKTPFTPLTVYGENNIAKSITIVNSETKQEETLEFDDLICNFGFTSNLGNIKYWQLNIENNKIVVNSAQKTNIDGICAIGDICTYDGKTSLIASGFGEAPVAVNSSLKYIDPNAVIGALRSSTAIKEK